MRRATAAPPGTALLFRRWSQGWVRFAQRCLLQFVSIPRSSQPPVPGWPGTCYKIVLRLLPATTTPEQKCNEPWAYQGQQDAGMEASQATPSAQAIPGDPKRSEAIPGDPRRSQAIPSDSRRHQAIPSEPNPATPSDPPGDPRLRRSQAIPSDATRAQAIPSHPKGSQAIPRDPQRSQASPGDPKRNQA